MRSDFGKAARRHEQRRDPPFAATTAMRHSVLVAATIVVVFATMLVELILSRSNERSLRARGAIEPDDDVYVAMAWVYPLAFLVMAAESLVRGGVAPSVTAAGVFVLVAGKAIKYWAVASLGERWTFRVLVLPATSLVVHGPYRYIRHPNYVGVMGELAGMALLVGAPITGVAAFVVFGWLIRRRIRTEERALGLRSAT